MIVIGLVGGVASGKSYIASCFRDLGAVIINGDEIGHRVLAKPDVIHSIGQFWPTVIDSNGKVDRVSLAKVVFRMPGHRENLRKLESITHPRISETIDFELNQLRSQGCVAAVLDAPVLIEAGWRSKCDKLVFVDAPLALRQERAKNRGWAEDELEQREKSQQQLAEKRSLATDVIHNDAGLEKVRVQVKQLWKAWGLTLGE